MQKNKRINDSKIIILAPSVLSADFSNLAKALKDIKHADCAWVHLDIMDGHFVPNLTFGATVIKSIRAVDKNLIFDTHLMIESPEKYIKDFANAGSNYITIHQEAVKGNEIAVLEMIKSYGVKAGISIKPKTPLSSIKHLYNVADMILIMSVEPGFGGQKLIPSTLNKVRRLKLLKEKYKYNYIIQIDGGINLETIGLAVSAGAESIVAGSAVFNKDSVKDNVKKLREAVAHLL